MGTDGTSRVNYFEYQYLRTQDFVAEQAYHSAMRRRHNVSHHRWGIVYGLEIAKQDGGLVLRPGFGVDGFGRELIMAQPRSLPLTAFDIKGSAALDVWLVYDQQLKDEPPPGYGRCDDQEAHSSFYRLQEQPRVELTPTSGPGDDRRAPPTVSSADLGFGPEQVPPDDPARQWPVFLGTIHRDRRRPEDPYSIEPAGRPYIGVVAEEIVDPSGDARVRLADPGAEGGAGFAVFVPGKAEGPSLSIGADQHTEVVGDAAVLGNLSIDGGTISLGPTTGDKKSETPWRIEHFVEEHNQHQLRVVMVQGAETVIGTWRDSKFVPCLTVGPPPRSEEKGMDCTVTIHGNLVVDGHVTEDKGRISGTLTEQSLGFLNAVPLQMLGALTPNFAGQLPEAVSGPSAPPVEPK